MPDNFSDYNVLGSVCHVEYHCRNDDMGDRLKLGDGHSAREQPDVRHRSLHWDKLHQPTDCPE